MSNSTINNIYNFALKNGATGGKLLGAGGGGFLLFYVEDFKKHPFLAAMREKGLIETRFKFDLAGIRSWKNRDEPTSNRKGEKKQ